MALLSLFNCDKTSSNCFLSTLFFFGWFFLFPDIFLIILDASKNGKWMNNEMKHQLFAIWCNLNRILIKSFFSRFGFRCVACGAAAAARNNRTRLCSLTKGWTCYLSSKDSGRNVCAHDDDDLQAIRRWRWWRRPGWVWLLLQFIQQFMATCRIDNALFYDFFAYLKVVWARAITVSLTLDDSRDWFPTTHLQGETTMIRLIVVIFLCLMGTIRSFHVVRKFIYGRNKVLFYNYVVFTQRFSTVSSSL